MLEFWLEFWWNSFVAIPAVVLCEKDDHEGRNEHVKSPGFFAPLVYFYSIILSFKASYDHTGIGPLSPVSGSSLCL